MKIKVEKQECYPIIAEDEHGSELEISEQDYKEWKTCYDNFFELNLKMEKLYNKQY